MADVLGDTISLQYGPQVPDPSHPSQLYPDGVLDPYNSFVLGKYHFFEQYDKEIITFKGNILYEAKKVARLGLQFNLQLGNFDPDTTDPNWLIWMFMFRFRRNPWRVVRFPDVALGNTSFGVRVDKLTTYLTEPSNSATLCLVDDAEVVDDDEANYYVKEWTFTLLLNKPMTIDAINALP